MRSISRTITLTTIISVGLILALGQIVVDAAISKWLTEQYDTALEARARALVTLTDDRGEAVVLAAAKQTNRHGRGSTQSRQSTPTPSWGT